VGGATSEEALQRKYNVEDAEELFSDSDWAACEEVKGSEWESLLLSNDMFICKSK
jgi:hypothetical protein